MQGLREAGADGFVLKESPINTTDNTFTKMSIMRMIKCIDSSLSMVFLKDVYLSIEKIKKHLISISNSSDERGLDEGLLKMKFKNEIFIQLDIIYDCLKKSSENISTVIQDENSYLNLAFISIHKILELINDYFTNERGDKLRSNLSEIKRFEQNSKTFVRINNGFPTAKDKIYTIINYELNTEPLEYFNSLNKYINYRNAIIHPKTLKDYRKTTKDDNLNFLKLMEDILIKIK